MNLNEFLQLYPVRAPNIMWVFGAGASAAANVATASQMIWDFKRRIYCAAERVPLAACANMNDPVLRERLQQYFTHERGYPATGADDEYAAFFEAMYPEESDRRRYIEQCVINATPSLGHLALAALLHQDRARVVITTNFDRVIEDAVAKIFNTSARLTVATLDTARVAVEALNEGRWPLLMKLHGDFQSRRLKNTPAELQAQERELEEALVEASRRFGLAVVGYSGRDASVMHALGAAVEASGAFPQGLFWFHRGPGDPLPRLTNLLGRARASGVSAHLLDCQSFDELMVDVLQQFEEVPAALRSQLDYRTRRISDAPQPPPGKGYPVIRLNALPVSSAPTLCRLVVCNIGGARDVRSAVESAGTDLLVARRKVGVLLFGSDDAARRTFSPYGITTFDVHAIAPQRLAYDSVEQGLLTEALARALSRERPLRALRRRSVHWVTIDPERQADPILRMLMKAAGTITGTVPTTPERLWYEAATIRLEQRYDRLWLLLEPTIWLDRLPGEALDDVSKNFVRERLARRYNAQVNALLDAWTAIITRDESIATLRAYGLTEGVDAVFTVHKTAAFSRRLTGREAAPAAAGKS